MSKSNSAIRKELIEENSDAEVILSFNLILIYKF